MKKENVLTSARLSAQNAGNFLFCSISASTEEMELFLRFWLSLPSTWLDRILFAFIFEGLGVFNREYELSTINSIYYYCTTFMPLLYSGETILPYTTIERTQCFHQ